MGSEKLDNKKLEAEIQFYGVSLDEVKTECKHFIFIFFCNVFVVVLSN